MSTWILPTKLHIPTSRNALIHRARLIEKLNAGLHRKLTVVSAPAGFGKTTLLGDWVSHCQRPVAWLSLSESDKEPVQFLSYLVAALQTVDSTIGHLVVEALKASQLPAIESLLSPLLNEIASVSDAFLLVLDDYHLVDSEPIEQAILFLLEHLPPSMHLVLATRVDPQLPLARLRVKGELSEVRATDLRFTFQETDSFLQQAMKLELPKEESEALTQRTEGWIAGLQLAGLSLQGLDDTSDFVRSFSGSHRFVLDYLLEEVLRQQSEDVRRFLLSTSILERLSGSLCNAVTENTGSQAMLERLERGNLFVVPLDHSREWYRFHHLFADALRLALREAQPETIRDLHLRACEWYVQHSQMPEAIHHALKAQAYSRASELLEEQWPSMDVSYQSGNWLSWAKQIPEFVAFERPLLCEGLGWSLLYAGQLEAALQWFQRAESWLFPTLEEGKQPKFVSQQQWDMLPASLALYRLYLSLVSGDFAATLESAEEALELVNGVDHYRRTQTVAMAGIAYWSNGMMSQADKLVGDLVSQRWDAEELADAVELTPLVAEVRVACGQLYGAYRVYRSAFQRLAERGNPEVMGLEDLNRGVSELYREWNQLEKAEDYLLAAEELGEQLVYRPNWYPRLYTSWAQLYVSQGKLDEALYRLQQAQEHYTRSPLPEVRSIEAQKARIWILQGDLQAAEEWARQQGLPLDGDYHFQHEFDCITYARLLLAKLRVRPSNEGYQRLVQLCQELQQFAGEEGRVGSVLEVLLVETLAHCAQGEEDLALESLEQALTLAEPEGYIRTFVDEGSSVKELLHRFAKSRTASEYVLRLLGAFGEPKVVPVAVQSLLDPLSEREMEVLHLLATELSGPEIARQIHVSLSTVRTHTRNIYSKLDVNSRRVAVRRAKELGLLA